MFPYKNINRRVRLRRSADVSVYVCTRFHPNAQQRHRYSVRDLSNKGAFIYMKPLHIHKDMQVNLTFALNLGAVVKLHRISAIVARVTQEGIGVRFLSAAEKLASRLA